MMTMQRHENNIVLIGNPFSQTGRGGTVLRFLRSFHAVNLPALVCDALSCQPTKNIDPWVEKELNGSLISQSGRYINIYHINGDEIDIALTRLQHQLPDGAFNIIYPFWELSEYPTVWAEKLNLFDEIWAPSQFIADALRKVSSKPIIHMPLLVDFKFQFFLGRKYFGLPEGSFLFLFFFDFRSYIDRKNPFAAIEVFENVCRARPYADVRLVLKVQGGGTSPQAIKGYSRFIDRIQMSAFANQIIVLDSNLNDNEIKNLMRCCDCFVSLHRSEGFGLGMAESMYLGKPVIATAYSGNMDFMREEMSLLVNYRLIPVEEGQYPFGKGQVWAEPDLEQATYFALKLLDDPYYGHTIGQRASQWMRVNFSALAMGLRYKRRIEAIDKIKS